MNRSGGIGFFSLLGIVFIILKLCNVITWSWWLVLLPLYGGFVLVYGFAFLAIVFTTILAFLVLIFGKK